MTTYKIKKVGRHNYRRVLKNDRLGNLITIPTLLRSQAAEAAARAKGEPFVFDIPDTARRNKPRYLNK